MQGMQDRSLYVHQRSAQVHHLFTLVLMLARLLGLLWFGLFRLWVLRGPALQGDLAAVSADTSTPWGTAFDGGIKTLRSQPLIKKGGQKKRNVRVHAWQMPSTTSKCSLHP